MRFDFAGLGKSGEEFGVGGFGAEVLRKSRRCWPELLMAAGKNGSCLINRSQSWPWCQCARRCERGIIHGSRPSRQSGRRSMSSMCCISLIPEPWQ